MAPEQAVGSNSALTTTTDVYGLGAVLYQLLTGHPPFAGGTTYETIKLLLDTEPRQPRLLNPKIDRDLSTICLKCLEKEPQCRYSSALALAQDLEHWLKREPIRARHSGVFTRGSKWARRNPAIAALIGSLVALAAALGWNVWKSEPVSSTYPRSIAVLPFENLSRDPDNASFADGMQDAVLTDLARIADLKVISRASVMQYKSGVARNLREIGQRLGVAYVVEGTVQRSGNLVRVDAQLIDTRTDKQVWAEVYDRDLVSVFGVESSIATTIADHLHAKLSSGEKSEIERTPTTNIAAFDLYTRAKNILLEAQMHTKAELLLAVDLLNQAVAHDPSFFDAYCELGYAHDRIYWTGAETTPARLALADTAIKAAARLRPDVGETHLARAQNLYWGYLDYDGALVELEVARRTLPNDFRVPRLMAAINRRQGDWEGSTRNLERCLELSPRDLESLDGLYTNYLLLRRYAEAKSALDRYIALRPDNVAGSRLLQACLEFQEKADIWPLHQRLDSIRATNPAEMQSSGGFWLVCAFAERDATAAKNALDACVDFRSGSFGSVVFLSRSMLEGLVARMTKDEAKARSAFVAAHAEQQRVVQAQPDNSRELSLLGLIDAALGRKEEALREGRRAVELLPVKKDPIVGVDMVVNLAIIAAWVGDKDLACEQLDSIIRRPGWLNNYGELKLLPWWDPLRGDPRFERLLEEAKQPVALN
jgi:TolB-like protein/tetratricopeptide (TPR) repeat protein